MIILGYFPFTVDQVQYAATVAGCIGILFTGFIVGRWSK